MLILRVFFPGFLLKILVIKKYLCEVFQSPCFRRWLDAISYPDPAFRMIQHILVDEQRFNFFPVEENDSRKIVACNLR